MSLTAASLDAAPKLRVQVDQNGDFILLGNTLAHDCSVSNPVVPSGRPSSCPFIDLDTGADVYWQVNNSNQVSATTTAANASSVAVLTIPAGATVTHAYLYWSAAIANDVSADTTATLRAPNGVTTSVSAIEWYVGESTGSQAQRAYQSVADVTTFVKTHGSGGYRVSDVDIMSLSGSSSQTAFAGWWMVVFYTLPSEPRRNLTLFDGLDPVSQNSTATVDLTGFLVPDAGYDGKLGVVAFEGDDTWSGDQLKFRGNVLSDARNPSNNFFNATRSYLGTAVSNTGDLPQVAGTADSMSGIDIDVVDVTSYLNPGLTSAQIQASTSTDVFFLGGFVTSISTYRPDFVTSTKKATDVNGGSLLVGDTLEYTITVTNSGNDTSVNTILTDPLPTGVTYVPGSLKIESGPNAGAKTDAADDDQAEYDPATRTVTFRLGTDATGMQGGKLQVNESTKVSFLVKVTSAGTISNQATITAAGELGAPVSNTPTGDEVPGEPTNSDVHDCDTDAECSGGQVCDTGASPRVCVECVNDDHCSGTTPTCDPGTNTCVCVQTNGGVEICDGIDNDCDGTVDNGFDVGAACSSGLGICEEWGQIVCDGSGGAVCNAVAGEPSQEVCGDAFDSDCDGNPNNGCGCLADDECGVGEICDTGLGASYECVPGCRGVGGNGCDNGTVCTSTDASVGSCVQCTEDSHCGDATSGKVCDTTTNTCTDGCHGTGGNGCEPGEICTSTDGTIGTCVECVEDSDCGDATSGKVCDTTTNTCTDGCHGTGGNGCEPGEICTSTDGTIGTCVECVEDSDCGDATSGKVCDTTTNTCTDGCRGTDGNGCEPGETCTSTDDTIGTCEEPGDGGAGGSDAGDGGTGGSDAGDAGDGGSDEGDAGDGGTGGTNDDGGAGDGGVGGADAGDDGDDDAGTGFGADQGDVWATGNGVLCATQPGSAGQGAGWLIGGAAVALALARRRRR